MNQHIPAPRRNIEYAAWGIVLLVLAHLCWCQVRPGSACRQLCAVATHSPAFQTMMSPYERFDRIADDTRAGNLLLQLSGPVRDNPAMNNVLSFLYFRTSYALYPRRLYVGPPDQIINDGLDVGRTEFNPDRQWLQQHDVRYRLKFGSEQPDEKAQLEILPLDDGQGGTSTNRNGGS